MSRRDDTPEALFKVDQSALSGFPVDAINAACLRAEAVIILLSGQFEAPDGRFADRVILNALWDVQGNLALVRAMLDQLPADQSIGGAND